MSHASPAYSVAEEMQPSGISVTKVSGFVPRPVVRPENLCFRRLHPRNFGPADMVPLSEAYRCWSEVWKSTLRELDGLPDVPSDEFTRQDEVCALFHGYECIGMTCFRWVDASVPMFRDDSYFKTWPSDAVETACAFGPRICILSNLTVAAPWRRAKGTSVMELLGALSVERFLASDGDTLVGTPRRDRGVNKLCYRLGFRPVVEEVTHHGVLIDLVAFYQRTSRRLSLSPQIEQLVTSLQP